MGLLINQNDRAGGFMIVQVSNGSLTHKMRFHIPAFGAADPTAAIPMDRPYLASVPANYEATVGETFYELAVCLRGMYNSNFYFTLAGLYANSNSTARQGTPASGTNGTFTPVAPIPRPVPIGGTSGGSNGWVVGQVTLSLGTIGGGRFSLRMISSEEWAPTGRKDLVPALNGAAGGNSPITITAAYLEGQVSGVAVSSVGGFLGVGTTNLGYTTGAAHSMICGHDGYPLIGPAVKTNCMNHRTRRSLRLT